MFSGPPTAPVRVGGVGGNSGEWGSSAVRTRERRREVRSAVVVVSLVVTTAGLLVLSPPLVLAVVVALALASVVVYRPAVAAYVLLGATPLTAGIDRGMLIPFLRPNEALAVLVGGALVVRALPGVVVKGLPGLRLGRTDVSILAMAVASSVLPLLWMALRAKNISQDDILHALTLWKYYGVFLIFRVSVRSERQVARCLWVAMVSAALVAVIAILQSLKLLGVPEMLSRYYAAFGNTAALQISRGSSTLSLPVAVADLMTFNIAVAWAMLSRDHGPRRLLYSAMAIFVLGALASGQFSGAIALVLCAVALAFIAGQVRPLIAAVAMSFVASVVLRPVILNRLRGFSSPEGLPESWVARLHNLRTYFWSDLFSDFNFVLGVRPSARVLVLQPTKGYVWIESGYTWLLWAGGIPFLGSFLYFIWRNVRVTAWRARRRTDAVGAAATGSCVSLVIVGVLMLFDPHLTYRGSADLLFALLALATGGVAPKGAYEGPDLPLVEGALARRIGSDAGETPGRAAMSERKHPQSGDAICRARTL